MRPKPLPLPLTSSELSRLWSKIDTSGECWMWTGSVAGLKGYEYGEIKIRGRSIRPHRLVKALITGDRQGLTIDHLCQNKLCCNPDHLEWVTITENHRRRRMNHCRRGHPAAEFRNSHGQCVECIEIRKRVRAAA